MIHLKVVCSPGAVALDVKSRPEFDRPENNEGAIIRKIRTRAKTSSEI